MDSPFIGMIIMFAGSFEPNGWAFCNGQLLSISQYTALFSILGTTYGGDGVRTFALPDLRGRVSVHAGQGPGLSPYVPGQTAGAENIALTVGNMPSHSHLIGADSATANQADPKGNIPGAERSQSSTKIYSSNPANATMSPAMVQPQGNNLPFSVLQPTLCINFIIALNGIYPSRG